MHRTLFRQEHTLAFRAFRIMAITALLMPHFAMADTVIFTDTCDTNPVQTLTNSQTITVGTSWSSAITLDGTPAAVMDSGTSNCGMNGAADESDDGTGNTMLPVPTTHDYYVDYTFVDGGAVGTNGAIGALVNYIDTSNYYACVTNDDASAAVDAYILKMSSGGNSTLASATNIARTLNGDTLECRIDYTGSNPVITLTDITEAAVLVTVTDSSSPLAKTERAGVMVGATPVRTTDDMDFELSIDTIRLVEEDVLSPTVTTQAVSSVTASTATLNGTMTDTGGATSTVRGFAWGTNSALSGGDTATTTENGNFGVGAFTGSLSSLTCNTTYYSRAYTTNSAGTGFGAISSSFTTSPCVPTVVTDAASDVNASSATLNGTISNDGGGSITEYGFAWGTNSALSGGDTATTTNGAGSTGAFNDLLSSLSVNTQYFFRAYATNSSGEGFGMILNFTTGSGTIEPPPRRMVLFEGFTLKFFEGTMILYQD